MSAEIADELRACAARIDADGTASQIVSADEMRELAAMAEAGGWQPIESAPKDGTVFHVWADGYLWPETVKWERYAPEDAEEIGEDGYWTFAEELLQNVTDDCGADLWTHWRPLPAPPSSLPNKEDRNG